MLFGTLCCVAHLVASLVQLARAQLARALLVFVEDPKTDRTRTASANHLKLILLNGCFLRPLYRMWDFRKRWEM